jgi:hypothetical protein
MRILGIGANPCHGVPCLENEQDVADGDWTNPVRDWGLNRFWTWRSAMETFSKGGMVQKRPFSGHTWALSADTERSRGEVGGRRPRLRSSSGR